MSSDTRLLMLGLQGVGKTTYLAALWHQLEAGELETAVTADHLQPDRTYLNRVRDAWLALKEVPRTSLRAEQNVALHLQTAESKIEVAFPDPSGEGLARLWGSRRAPSSFVSGARDAHGALLFVHPKRIRVGERIPPTDDATHETTAEEPAWKPETVPTQVQLVDLLQITAELRASTDRLPLAMIVSAWDLVKDPILPEDWLRRRLPMLWQFLSTTSAFDVGYFGVSAIGGDLASDERQRLAEIRIPAERVVVHTANQSGQDLTLPLRHLLARPGR